MVLTLWRGSTQHDGEVDTRRSILRFQFERAISQLHTLIGQGLLSEDASTLSLEMHCDGRGASGGTMRVAVLDPTFRSAGKGGEERTPLGTAYRQACQFRLEVVSFDRLVLFSLNELGRLPRYEGVASWCGTLYSEYLFSLWYKNLIFRTSSTISARLH